MSIAPITISIEKCPHFETPTTMFKWETVIGGQKYGDAGYTTSSIDLNEFYQDILSEINRITNG